MKKQEFMKLFNNENIWNNIKKIDKRIDDLTNFLNEVLIKEIFDKLYKDFNNKSYTEITEIKEQIIEINSLLHNRKIRTACRRMKGLIEDSIAFICQNYDIESVSIHANTNTSEFRDILMNENEQIFSFLNKQISREYNYLKVIYDYVAKIDHTTSLRIFTKNLEEHKKLKNIQYSYYNIVIFIIFLLFDFIYTFKQLEYNDNIDFILDTISMIVTLITISSIRNFDKKEYLHIQMMSDLTNDKDCKYINQLNEWNKKVYDDLNDNFSNDDTKIISEAFSKYEEKLKLRKYI